MRGNIAASLCLALALSFAAGPRAEAQGKDSSNAPAAGMASVDTTDTYVTTDGYGLGRIVPGSLEDVTQRARAAMIKLKVVEEPGRSRGSDVRELRGKGKDNLDVAIVLKRQSATSTRVEVTARRGLADYDQQFARKVLDAIGKTAKG
jgi:hypothetical protein